MPKDADVQSYFKIGQLNATSGIILKYMKIVIPHSLWERILLNTILCLSLMITTTIQILFLKYKQSLLITSKKTFQLWIRSYISLKAVQNNIRITKKNINLCHHQQDFNMDAEWIFFATSYGNSSCDGVGGFVKCYVEKCSLQRLLHDQILSYQ